MQWCVALGLHEQLFTYLDMAVESGSVLLYYLLGWPSLMLVAGLVVSGIDDQCSPRKMVQSPC